MDWYLAPTGASPYRFTAALYNLTGPPAIPPRYGFGFMTTYWGYRSLQEVEGYMQQFRNGSYPIDSFIMDYDWFGSTQSLGCMCGTDGENGALASGDFGYKGKIWANQSFASIASKGGKRVFCKGPADVLAHFHDDLDMKFGAIRKPRSYSNLNLSCEHGWALAPGCDQFTPARPYRPGATVNWNYSTPEFRSWYAAGHAHFLKDGIDFWWNDEGEKQWCGKFGKLSNVLTRFLPGSLSYSYAHRDVSPMLGDDIHHIVLIGAASRCNRFII